MLRRYVTDGMLKYVTDFQEIVKNIFTRLPLEQVADDLIHEFEDFTCFFEKHFLIPQRYK